MNDRQLTDWEKRRWEQAEKNTLAYQAEELRGHFRAIGLAFVESFVAHPIRWLAVIAAVELAAIVLTT